MKISTLLKAGAVRRFHVMPTIRENTVAEHSWQVVMLVLLLTDYTAPAEWLIYAAQHDMAEFETGDIPSPAKKLVGIKDQVSAAEESVLEQFGVVMPTISAEGHKVMKLADCLSGMLNCVTERSMGNKNVTECFHNYLAYVIEAGPYSRIQAGIIEEVHDAWKEACE